MNVLIVGSGGREHAILHKLAQNKSITHFYAAPGNGGMADLAECVPLKATDVDGIVAFAKANDIGFVVVAPDDPLVLGMVDALQAQGIQTFGPTKLAAQIEGSKVYSKYLMEKYNIPTADYQAFDDAKTAIDYIKANNTYPIVIKADGLALGKGVLIAEDFAAAADAVNTIMTDQIFGASGNQIVVEEFLTGPEVSVLAFADGKTVVPMVSSMDHKRALDGDRGLNTGGMGTVAPNPAYTKEIAKVCMDTIFLPTIDALNQEGRPFSGCLYFGLMLTPQGPKIIEYNCRFGDPETQVVLPLLKTDLFTIFQAIAAQKLDCLPIEWEDKSAACVVMASGGYPVSYQTGFAIQGLEQVDPAIMVFHAGTKAVDGNILTSGGRVLGVTAVGDDLTDALQKAYQAVEKISFEGAYCRRDIGQKALSFQD